MKIYKKLLLVSVTLLFLCLIIPVPVKAESKDLSNGESINYTPIDTYDVQEYDYKMTNNGYATIQFNAPNNSMFDVSITVKSNNLSKKYTSASCHNKNVFDHIFLEKDSIISITISDDNGYSDLTYCQEYNLKLTQTDTSDFEKEFNDNINSANQFSIGTKANPTILKGNFYTLSDEDYFCFQQKKNGFISINFDNIDSSNAKWGLSILNDSGDVLYTDIVEYSTISTYLAQGKYFIKISSPYNDSYSYLCIDKMYQMKCASLPFSTYGKSLIMKLVKKNSSTVAITLKKNAYATGYYIQYSTSKDFHSNVKTLNLTTTSKKITKLSSGKTYYFRTCSYHIDDDGNIIKSPYSSIKKLTL